VVVVIIVVVVVVVVIVVAVAVLVVTAVAVVSVLLVLQAIEVEALIRSVIIYLKNVVGHVKLLHTQRYHDCNLLLLVQIVFFTGYLKKKILN
jgi:hypothetical protein